MARAAAVRAGELALRHQARGLTAETKDDLSPVTVADREGERLIASMLAEAFPEDGLLGEEGGQARESRCKTSLFRYLPSCCSTRSN